MDLHLRDKVAIVGGASQGIGFAVARTLAEEGVKVVITARREAPLNAAAETVREKTGGSVLAVPSDVRRAEDCVRVVDGAVKTFGRIDILINNDGAPPLGKIEDFDDAAWDKAVQQNLYSVIRMVRQTVPHMKAVGGGRIVNITAVSARQPLVGLGLSVATWAGVLGYAKTLSLELGPAGITVNTICPGRIDTGRLELVTRKRAEQLGQDPDKMMQELLHEVPLRRLGTPDDVAGLVALLVSPRGAFITGTAIQVDGGLLRSVY
ncbi:MAG: SDR family oxidoreductase [Betaproteobacteria bacterium]|nr:SDR family oxidoreductase [Betaproteobacteria bacterium]